MSRAEPRAAGLRIRADRLRWKRRLGTAFALLPRAAHRRVVLIYHAVGSSPWAIDHSVFKSQMEWLCAHARLSPLEELLAPSNTDTSPQSLQVALTFDDGYACLADVVLPILSDLGVRATVYLNTGRIGGRERLASDAALGHYPAERFLAWADVERLASSGWMIGSHGVEHRDLSVCSQGAVDRELLQSRKEIESRLGGVCRHFCYTWGRHTAILRSRVAAAGYSYAAAAVHAPLGATYDQLAFPRMDISRHLGFEDFTAVLRGDWDYLGWVQRVRG